MSSKMISSMSDNLAINAVAFTVAMTAARTALVAAEPTGGVSFRRAFNGIGGLHSSFHFNTPSEDNPGGLDVAPKPEPFKGLREEFSRLYGEAHTVIDTVTRENREMKPEEKTANETRFTRMTAIKNTLDEAARFAALKLSGGADAVGSIQLPQDANGRAEFDASEGRGKQTGPKADDVDRVQFNRALVRWSETGDMDRKFATITSATQSGALLPKTIALPDVPTVGNVLREAMDLYTIKPVYTTGTEAMTIPILGAAAGGVVAENANAETENAPTLTDSIVLNVSTYQSGTGYFSNLVLNANSFDLVQYIQTDLLDAKEQGLEAAAIAAIIADATITQIVPTSTTATFTYANLVDLNRSLPKRFDRQKVILLSRTAYATAEKLLGDDGHPVLTRDPQNQELLRFNGTPVLRCDNLEGFGATKVIGLVISLRGFRLRDTANQKLHRITQNTAKVDQTGFNLIGYHAYGYAVTAIAKLRTPAS
ncbi:MAG TPA: phage major capsid protein [Tepidisphaeraceae bacterium]|nr:phage major capsid protein [Tepidisphaeraceae bacterium]